MIRKIIAGIREKLMSLRPDTLRMRFVMGTLLLFLLPTIALLYIEWVYEPVKIRESTHEQLTTAVAMQRAEIERWLENKAAYVKGVTQLQVVRRQDLAAIRDILQTYVQNQDDFKDFIYVDQAGRVLIDTAGIRPVGMLADREYFQAGQAGYDFITDVIIGRASGEPVIVISSPLYDLYDGFRGVIFGVMKLDTLHKIINRFHHGSTGKIYLIDRHGQVIAGPNLLQAGSTAFTHETLTAAKLDDSGIATYTDYRGQTVLAAFQRLESRGWVVIAEVDEAEAFAAYNRRLKDTGAALAALLLLLLPLSILIINSLTNPIRELTKAAERVRDGDYNVMVDEEKLAGSPRELRLLCSGFNMMTATVRENIQLLEAANETMAQAEAKYRTVVESSLIGVFIMQDGKFEYVNPRFCSMVGYREDELLGQINFWDLVDPDDIKAFQVKRQNAAGNAQSERHQLRLVKKDGDSIITELYITLGRIGGRLATLGTILDVTERHRIEEELRRLSLYDEQTGLYNRAFFKAEIYRLSKGRDQCVSIVVVDVDGLKLINDTLGHSQGDALLKAAAQALMASFRAEDIVARVGGDEFAVILPFADRPGVERAVNRIYTAIDNHNLAYPEVPLYLSVGYAIYGEEVTDPEDLLRQADNAMYRQKFARRDKNRQLMLASFRRAYNRIDYLRGGHAERAASLAFHLAHCLKLDVSRCHKIHRAALYHDIGMIGVAQSVFRKTGSLAPDEAGQIRRHCEVGYRLAMIIPDLSEVAEWILHHHEWYDGTGYPLGLKANEIPLESRIIRLADSFDAMTHDRSYRQAVSRQAALAEINREAGRQFDPEVAAAFITMIEMQQYSK